MSTMSTETEALAEWWQTFDGPAYPSGEEFARALLASDWLAAYVAARVAEALADAADWIESTDSQKGIASRALSPGKAFAVAALRDRAALPAPEPTP